MDSAEGGFETLTPYAEARNCVQSTCTPHERRETVSTADALGRVAAEAVDAPRQRPHYERVTTDGIAVRAADTFEASERSPVRLSEGTAPLSEGEGVPVGAGHQVPAGATAVVGVAHTKRRDDGIDVFDAVAVGANVASTGSEVETGDRLLDHGQRLTPTGVSLLQATGVETVTVFERPRVAVIPTGDSLVETAPEPGEHVETNREMVESLVERWGGDAFVRDTVTGRSAIREVLSGTLDADGVVTTGCSSVGTDDVVPDIVDSIGTLQFHGVTIDPGHSVGFGTVEETPVLLLPGSPHSAYLDAVQFLRPALASLGGTTTTTPPSLTARLDGKLPSEPGTRTFAQVTLDTDESGTRRATPLCVGSACRLSTLPAGDGWVEIFEETEGIPSGERVEVQQWDRGTR